MPASHQPQPSSVRGAAAAAAQQGAATLRPASSSASTLHAAAAGGAAAQQLSRSPTPRTASPSARGGSSKAAPGRSGSSRSATLHTPHAPPPPPQQQQQRAAAAPSGSRSSSPAPTTYRYALGPAPVRFPSAQPAAAAAAAEEHREVRSRSRSAAGGAGPSVAPAQRSSGKLGSSSSHHLEAVEAGPSSRVRTQSSPSPSALFTPTPLPTSASSASLAARPPHDPHASATTNEATPLLRPPLRFGSRPNSQVFTSFPFPHPTATPPLAAAGQRSWLSRLWSRRGSSSVAPEPDAAIATPHSIKPAAAADPEDPYGYRALAGPALLPAFHAPRLALAREGISLRAGRRLACGLAAAVVFVLLLGYAFTMAGVILQGAHWPGLGEGLAAAAG